MDADYGHNEDGDDKWSHGFGHSLFVCSTVMSVPDPARVVVDAGLKSMAFDSGMPVVADDCARCRVLIQLPSKHQHVGQAR